MTISEYRDKGMFEDRGNYEPQIQAPYDARLVVKTKAALTNKNTWTTPVRRLPNVYTGMVVAVTEDGVADNNGIYYLKKATLYDRESGWVKLATTAQLENGTGSGSASIEVASYQDLPQVGVVGITYYVKNEASIYRWDENTVSYVKYGSGELESILNIKAGDNVEIVTEDKEVTISVPLAMLGSNGTSKAGVIKPMANKFEVNDKGEVTGISVELLRNSKLENFELVLNSNYTFK